MMYTEDQLQEVTSWLQDEGRSVTIATVSQSLELSRSQAQALLEQLAEGKDVFRVTAVPSEETNSTAGPIPTTVFKLSQSNQDGYIYAVTEKESLTTAHERDMDQMREMLKNNQLHSLTASATDVILPAEQIIPMMQHNSQSTDRPIVSSLDRSKVAAPVKKVTTAESFFQKKSSTTTAATGEKTTKVVKEPSKESKISAHSFSKKAKETSKENEKENNAKVGRVDDFVGDEDDSDEDMEVDAAPRKKIIRGRKQQKEEKVEEDLVVEKEPALPVRGAMDDFATEAKRPIPQTETSGRRRRKKLVQKTSMDAQGYLHTETQEIWEDIPSDEEDEPIFVPKKPTAPQSSSTKKVAMKQGSLLGFFTKK